MLRSTSLLALSLALATLVTTAEAATVTIGTDQGLVTAGRDNQGWWSSETVNTNATNDNYILLGSAYRDYFTFDLSGLAGKVITGLELQLRRYNQVGDVTVGFFDVSTSASALAQRQVSNASIFADLGSGNSYGSFSPANGNSTDVLSFVLNGQAVTDAQASIGGYFSIGGALLAGNTLFSASGSEPGNGGSGYTQSLVVTYTDAPTVPVPASLPLLGAGLAGLVALRRKKA